MNITPYWAHVCLATQSVYPHGEMLSIPSSGRLVRLPVAVGSLFGVVRTDGGRA